MKTLLKLPSLFFLKSVSSNFAPDGSRFRLFTTHLQFVKVHLKGLCLGLDTSFQHKIDFHLPYSEHHTSVNAAQDFTNF